VKLLAGEMEEFTPFVWVVCIGAFGGFRLAFFLDRVFLGCGGSVDKLQDLRSRWSVGLKGRLKRASPYQGSSSDNSRSSWKEISSDNVLSKKANG
jgi:hypothetical protein